MQIKLTQAELKILALIVKGLNNNKIAKELNISLSTVKTHNTNIFRKLNIESRLLAAVYAVENGIISK